MPTIPVKQIERNRRKIAELDHVSVPLGQTTFVSTKPSAASHWEVPREIHHGE